MIAGVIAFAALTGPLPKLGVVVVAALGGHVREQAEEDAGDAGRLRRGQGLRLRDFDDQADPVGVEKDNFFDLQGVFRPNCPGDGLTTASKLAIIIPAKRRKAL